MLQNGKAKDAAKNAMLQKKKSIITILFKNLGYYQTLVEVERRGCCKKKVLIFYMEELIDTSLRKQIKKQSCTQMELPN